MVLPRLKRRAVLLLGAVLPLSAAVLLPSKHQTTIFSPHTYLSSTFFHNSPKQCFRQDTYMSHCSAQLGHILHCHQYQHIRGKMPFQDRCCHPLPSTIDRQGPPAAANHDTTVEIGQVRVSPLARDRVPVSSRRRGNHRHANRALPGGAQGSKGGR
jgi:hypothetical protein